MIGNFYCTANFECPRPPCSRAFSFGTLVQGKVPLQEQLFISANTRRAAEVSWSSTYADCHQLILLWQP